MRKKQVEVPESVIEPFVLHFGLPSCLWVPIAASSVDAITAYVGSIEQTKLSRDGRINAILVRPFESSSVQRKAPLWREPNSDFFWNQLHPDRQVWVHVDYRRYRKAYQDFGQPPIPKGYFLDHVQNRRAVRLRGYGHPFLRLCPTSHEVNTSGGHATGGEGMEVEFAANLTSYSKVIQEEHAKALRALIVFADPLDLTKMINIAPGTGTLNGVRDVQHLFYP